MKNVKRKMSILVASALGAALYLAITAGPSLAKPTENSRCSSCHTSDNGVTVSTTVASQTSSTTTYNFTISGPYSGRSGYGVYNSGGTKVASGLVTSGSFTVNNGTSYTFYGVDKDPASMKGYRSSTLSPAAPASPTSTPPQAAPTGTPPAATPTSAPAAATPVPSSSTSSGQGDIVNTKHNVASPGSAACLACHIPHNAQGSYLWARSVGAGSGIKPLCYSCHDGSVTSTGWIAFDATKSQHAVSPGTKGQDCDLCHDPHRNSFKFTTLGNLAADLCSSCHGNSGSNNHPIDVVAVSPAPTDRIWDPNATPADFNGTRLWDSPGNMMLPMGSGYIKCLTCHAPHGGSGSSLNTMPLSNTGDTNSPLCQNCHK